MYNSLPITVRVDGETAGAARRLRELFASPAGADLCAGAVLSVDTLERIHTAVAGLYFHTQEMMELARGERVPLEPTPKFLRYTFGVVDRHGEYVGGLEILGGPAMTAEQAREHGAQALANKTPERWARFDTPTLSREAPTVANVWETAGGVTS